MTSKKNVATLRYLRKETADMLREKASGKRCKQHKKPVKLGVLWADGRAIAFFCGDDCFHAWEDRQGAWAEVVQVVPVNR